MIFYNKIRVFNMLPQEIQDKIFLLTDFKTLENTRVLQSKYVQNCTHFDNYYQAIYNHNVENVKWLYNILKLIYLAIYNMRFLTMI